MRSTTSNVFQGKHQDAHDKAWCVTLLSTPIKLPFS